MHHDQHNARGMKRPAIFFDRDNTLIVSDGYLGDPAKVVLIEGAAQAIARARSLGFATVVVSNQSGVARGLYSEDELGLLHRDIAMELAAVGAHLDGIRYCPFHPDALRAEYRGASD